MVLNSLNFCLSVKFLISPSNQDEIIAGQSSLGSLYKLLVYVILVQFCLNDVMHIINFSRFLFKYIF